MSTAQPTFALCRFNRGLDRTFGLRGIALTDFLSQKSEVPGAIAVDDRDRIIVAGTAKTSGGTHRFAVARYQPSGELDRTRGTVHILDPTKTRLDPGFGKDGKVLTNFRLLRNERVNDVLVDNEGRIVVVGTGEAGGGGRVIVIARYLEDGTLDSSFDGEGVNITDFFSRSHEWARAVAIDSQDRIIIGGLAAVNKLPKDIMLARYLTNGRLDPAFDADGKVLARFGSRSKAFDIAIGPGDTIIIAGNVPDGGLARFRPDGTVDNSFGSGGTVKHQLGSFHSPPLRHLDVDSKGRIVVAGTARERGASSIDRRWLVARYLADGSLDPQFGAGKGWVSFNVRGGNFDVVTDMVVDSADEIVLVGWVKDRFDDSRVAAARLFPSGDPDPNFDDGGNGFLLAPLSLSGSPTRTTKARVATDESNRVLLATHFERRVDRRKVDTLTGFLPSLHGWRFENVNIPHRLLDVPFSGGAVSVVTDMSLCGGMALGAKDHFDFDQTLPDQSEPPDDRSKLFNYLLDRQLHSLGKKKLVEPFHPAGPWGRKFRRWWRESGGATTASDTELCARTDCSELNPDAEEVLGWSTSEFKDIEQALTRRRETILIGLIRDDAKKLWDHHQVLAYHLEREGSGELAPAIIWIYDPNHPGDDEQRLRITFQHMHFGIVGSTSTGTEVVIETIEQLPSRRCTDEDGNRKDYHRCLRGVFQMEHGSGNLPDVEAKQPPSALLVEFTGF